MPINIQRKIVKAFQQRYGEQPGFLVSAPGRINLIGEHTDYSDGFVLPVAINRKISIAFRARKDTTINVYAVDFNESAKIDIRQLKASVKGWQPYIEGVAWALQTSGFSLRGWDGVIGGDIPIGAGLSSSAALEIAAARVFSQTSDLALSQEQLAKICQMAEMNWVGVNVGIMDQLISAAGKAGCAMKLDCRTLEHEYFPIPPGVQVFVLDTMTRRELTHSDYNTRHAEVELACSTLGISHLRDADLAIIEKLKTPTNMILFRRAKHVFEENQRVHDFCNAMQKGDFKIMGRLLNQSHKSLRDNFEVSSDALNLIVEIAQNHPSCFGARMTGAGFGGCALALLKSNDDDAFINHVSENYKQEIGIEPKIFRVESADGVCLKRYRL